MEVNSADVCNALMKCCRVNYCLAQKTAFAFLICYRFINLQCPETQLWLGVFTLESHGSLEACNSIRKSSSSTKVSGLNKKNRKITPK